MCNNQRLGKEQATASHTSLQNSIYQFLFNIYAPKRVQYCIIYLLKKKCCWWRNTLINRKTGQENCLFEFFPLQSNISLINSFLLSLNATLSNARIRSSCKYCIIYTCVFALSHVIDTLVHMGKSATSIFQFSLTFYTFLFSSSVWLNLKKYCYTKVVRVVHWWSWFIRFMRIFR